MQITFFIKLKFRLKDLKIICYKNNIKDEKINRYNFVKSQNIWIDL